MKISFKLKNGRILEADSDLATIRHRKQLLKKLAKQPIQIHDDKEVLADLEEQFKKTPPKQMEIYKGFLRLIKKENDDSSLLVDFENELCRICCQWVDGDKRTPLTEDEFMDLPIDVFKSINDLFDSEEKGFFILPESKI